MEKRVLLKDIAAKVGVSIALVSYVLNNKQGRVGNQMAEKIRRTAAEMNYLPNLVAKSLQSGRSNTIGLVVADISNSFFSQIARIIEQEAETAGYTVIFGSTDESAEKSKLLVEAFLNRQVDGLIVAAAADTIGHIRLLKKNKVPFVLIDRYFSGLSANSVRINNFQSAFDATDHLAQGGRQRIALVTYRDTGMSHFAEREAGYRAAIKRHRLRTRCVYASYNDMHTQLPLQIARTLNTSDRPDALFFATHSLAIEGLKQVRRLHLKVPQDLAVLSFDEDDAFDLFDPPVSFIRQPLQEIGAEAVRLLTQTIRRPSARPKVIELATELVLRDSCTPLDNHHKKRQP